MEPLWAPSPGPRCHFSLVLIHVVSYFSFPPCLPKIDNCETGGELFRQRIGGPQLLTFGGRLGLRVPVPLLWWMWCCHLWTAIIMVSSSWQMCPAVLFLLLRRRRFFFSFLPFSSVFVFGLSHSRLAFCGRLNCSASLSL